MKNSFLKLLNIDMIKGESFFMKFKILKLNFLLINFLFFPNIVNAEANYFEESGNKPGIEYLKSNPNNNFYIIGPGDAIKIEVNKSTKDLNTEFVVDGDGNAYLSRLEKIYVKGLTINELKDILNRAYAKFVREPNVKLSVKNYRPIKVFVEGEVVNPGMHILAGSSNPLNVDLKVRKEQELERKKYKLEPEAFDVNIDINSTESLSKGNYLSVYFPTLFDVIKKSEGLTVHSNLENIEVTRINNLTNGGGRIYTTINLLKALNLSDVTQNIRVFDGDTIKISRSDKPLPEKISSAMKANLNPKFIRVITVGGVMNPGELKINKSSTLSQAIDYSGGLRALSGPIIFIRHKGDGEIDRRKFRYSRFAKAGSFKNPYLRNGDIIVASKSGYQKSSETLSVLTSPIRDLITSYSFYKLISD